MTDHPVPGSGAPADRAERFAQEIDELRLKGSSGRSERILLAAGAALVVVGILLGILGAVQVINAGDSPADQRAAMASGSLLGIVLVIAGAACFVRYSLGRFLRFWLIRLVHESRADTDRIVDAIDRAAGPPPPVGGGH